MPQHCQLSVFRLYQLRKIPLPSSGKRNLKSWAIKSNIQPTVSLKRIKNPLRLKKAKITSKKISNLKESKKYYFRIRTYKSSNKKTRYSKWSKVKSIKTPKDTKCNKDNIQKETHCTNNNNHSIKCGNIGRWFNSRSDIETYWKNQCNALAEKWDKGEISDSEYYSKSPYGYECWSCSYCGKWTGNFKYR